MDESLDDVKQRLSRKYLGRAGIHGVGVHRDKNAISIYLQAEGGPEQETVLEEIQKEAAPYQVLPVQADQARIT